MNTITLRTLLRKPLKAKRWTRSGKCVQVTEGGEPLWILQPANAGRGEGSRRHATVKILDEVLCERPSRISAVGLVEESRR